MYRHWPTLYIWISATTGLCSRCPKPRLMTVTSAFADLIPQHISSRTKNDLRLRTLSHIATCLQMLQSCICQLLPPFQVRETSTNGHTAR